ncbi:hypothetical protein [Nocardia sp. NPDC051570]|uniref:hypothetical protein n=1 Tax=Nocardia sp. NPDC051570 TaxID=3364324 RepID=UPI00379EF263
MTERHTYPPGEDQVGVPDCGPVVKKREQRRQWLGVIAAMTVAALSAGLVNPADASARRIGPYDVYGAIEVEYDQAGGFGLFGNPVNAESAAARGGRWQGFERGSSIYWHPNVSNGRANQIGGLIRDKWRDLGWENGALKYPTTRELPTRKPGRFNHFEGGSIYWSGATGAHNVWGAIRDKWAAYDWENGPLGFPTSDEFKVKDGGVGHRFEGGSIYWSPQTGAHVVWGAIKNNWASRNWENGRFGFPTSDEFDFEGGKAQNFQGGTIDWKSGDQDNPADENHNERPQVIEYKRNDPTLRTNPDAPDETGPPSPAPSLAPAPSTTTPAPGATTRPATPSPAAPEPTVPKQPAPTTTVQPAPTSDPATPDADNPHISKLVGTQLRQNSPDDEDEPYLPIPCGFTLGYPHESKSKNGGKLLYPAEIHTQVVSKCDPVVKTTDHRIKAKTSRLRWFGVPLPQKQLPSKGKQITQSGYQAEKSSNDGAKLKMTSAIKCEVGTRFRYMTFAVGEFAYPNEKYRLYGPNISTNPQGKEITCIDKPTG